MDYTAKGSSTQFKDFYRDFLRAQKFQTLKSLVFDDRLVWN